MSSRMAQVLPFAIIVLVLAVRRRGIFSAEPMD